MAAKDEIAEAPAYSGCVIGAALAPAGRCPVCRLYAAAVAQVDGCEPGPAELPACGLIKPPCASRSLSETSLNIYCQTAGVRFKPCPRATSKASNRLGG